MILISNSHFHLGKTIRKKWKRSASNTCERKTEKDRSHAEIALICMMKKYFYPSNITHKTWRINVQLMKSSMKRLKRSLKLINTKNGASYAKFVFRFFFSMCLNITNINALLEKKSTCVDLVPFLTHFF